jgi:hypothetical protein
VSALQVFHVSQFTRAEQFGMLMVMTKNKYELSTLRNSIIIAIFSIWSFSV